MLAYHPLSLRLKADRGSAFLQVEPHAALIGSDMREVCSVRSAAVAVSTSMPHTGSFITVVIVVMTFLVFLAEFSNGFAVSSEPECSLSPSRSDVPSSFSANTWAQSGSVRFLVWEFKWTK